MSFELGVLSPTQTMPRVASDRARWDAHLEAAFRQAVERAIAEASKKTTVPPAAAAQEAAPTAKPEPVTPFLKRLCANGAPVRVSRVVLQLLHDTKETSLSIHRPLYAEGVEDAHCFQVPVGADPEAAACRPILEVQEQAMLGAVGAALSSHVDDLGFSPPRLDAPQFQEVCCPPVRRSSRRWRCQ